jgi:glycosyltransferase involved in cell wall biosynthesis
MDYKPWVNFAASIGKHPFVAKFCSRVCFIMRILQVFPHLSKGGAERVVVELSNSLSAVGHEVTLLLAFPIDPSLNERSLDNKVCVQFVSAFSTNRFLPYLKLPSHIMRNWKDLKNYDAIHCHLTFGLIFGSLISIFRKIKGAKKLRVIATCHVVGGGLSRTRRILNERLSYFFDVFALMAQDTQWRNFISSKKRKNFQVVTNGISSSAWERRVKPQKENPIWTVGTISRLEKERKPWLFLEVFAQLDKLTKGNVHFVLGGEGPERENLERLSKELKLSKNLSMPGLVRDPQDFLRYLDLYVALNVEEITGIAGLEAVFSGIPTFGIQLSPNYNKGASDWIWSDQDPKKVAAELARMLEKPKNLSKVATNQYGIAIRDYSISRMRNDYLNLYMS